MGVEARPGVQFELTLTEIGEVADERARQVKRLLDEIEPVERNRFRRKLLELIAEDFIHVRAATEANLMASADMAATETHGQSHIRTFDAVFHALAIAEQAILLTADEKHRNKTAATFGSVALIGELEM
jgi:predicted nucleic acid-binding protein